MGFNSQSRIPFCIFLYDIASDFLYAVYLYYSKEVV